VTVHEDGGFDWPSCAGPDDPNGLRPDLCENGIERTTWELDPARVGCEFFAAYTVGELVG
jgi:hypothetical protein